jgi:hypothetical protein
VESLHLQRQWSLRRIWNRRGMCFPPEVESRICISVCTHVAFATVVECHIRDIAWIDSAF